MNFFFTIPALTTPPAFKFTFGYPEAGITRSEDVMVVLWIPDLSRTKEGSRNLILTKYDLLLDLTLREELI